jgi:hypothetical protein
MAEALSRLARQLERATDALQQETVRRERAERALVEADARLGASEDRFRRYFELGLIVEDFLAQLALGLAHSAFARGEFAEAERRYRDVVEKHASTDAAPEALYWAGVARYKATGDPAALAETAAQFRQRFRAQPGRRKPLSGKPLGPELRLPAPELRDPAGQKPCEWCRDSGVLQLGCDQPLHLRRREIGSRESTILEAMGAILAAQALVRIRPATALIAT